MSLAADREVTPLLASQEQKVRRRSLGLTGSILAYHLQVIAASHKKTDKRDAYWIARTLQTGMTPHPVYIPTGQVRR